MATDPGFDVERAHRHFAATNFNRCWELIEKDGRSPEDNEQMLLLAQSSLWHWTQRPDLQPDNLAIGHWQLARVNALLGNGEDALRHAERSLEIARDINAASATALAADLPAVASDVVPAGVDPATAAQRNGDHGDHGDHQAYLLAYAHEAMARAKRLAGDEDGSEYHLSEGRRLAAEIVDREVRKSLLDDLGTV